MNTRQKGNIAEERGCHYLKENGFRIIERNLYNRFGEIDIIAIRGDTLHFIEVKSGRSYEQAIFNITPHKLQKLTRTIQTYIQQKKLDLPYCIDALIITPEGISFIENITL